MIVNHGFFLIFPTLCRQKSPSRGSDHPNSWVYSRSCPRFAGCWPQPPQDLDPKGSFKWWLVEHGGTNAENWSQHELSHPFLGCGNCFGNWKSIFLMLMDLIVYNLDCPCSTNVFSDGKSRPLLGLAVRLFGQLVAHIQAHIQAIWGFSSLPRERSWSSCPTTHSHGIRYTRILNGISPGKQVGLLTIYLHLLWSTS